MWARLPVVQQPRPSVWRFTDFKTDEAPSGSLKRARGHLKECSRKDHQSARLMRRGDGLLG